MSKTRVCCAVQMETPRNLAAQVMSSFWAEEKRRKKKKEKKLGKLGYRNITIFRPLAYASPMQLSHLMLITQEICQSTYTQEENLKHQLGRTVHTVSSPSVSIPRPAYSQKFERFEKRSEISLAVINQLQGHGSPAVLVQGPQVTQEIQTRTGGGGKGGGGKQRCSTKVGTSTYVGYVSLPHRGVFRSCVCARHYCTLLPGEYSIQYMKESLAQGGDLLQSHGCRGEKAISC